MGVCQAKQDISIESSASKISDTTSFDSSIFSCMSHQHITAPDLLELKASEDGNNKVVKLIEQNEILRNVTLGTEVSSSKHKPIIIAGPSGVGKGTLIAKLTEKYPSSFGFSVSYTTRDPRPGEVDGVNYNFITKDKFKEMIEAGDFIEYFEVHTNFYGTAK